MIQPAALLVLTLLATAPAQQTSPLTSTHGTRVSFMPSPKAAFQRARRTGRPVFLLHLSGNFPVPGET